MTARLLNSRDTELLERAQRVVPNGVWGHMATRADRAGVSAVLLALGRVPGLGCRRQRIYRLHVRLGSERAWLSPPRSRGGRPRAHRSGDIGNGPTDTMVRSRRTARRHARPRRLDALPEERHRCDDGLRDYRARATGRRKILVARGAYHGAVPWCSPSLVGVTTEDRAHLVLFDYNDIASLDAAVLRRAMISRASCSPPSARCRHGPGSAGGCLPCACPRRLRSAGCRSHPRRCARGLPSRCPRQLGELRREARPRRLLQGDRQWLAARRGGGQRVDPGRRGPDLRHGLLLVRCRGHGSRAIATIRILRDSDALAHTEAMGNRFRDGLVTSPPAMASSSGKPVRCRCQWSSSMGTMICASATPSALAGLRHGIYLHPQAQHVPLRRPYARDIDRALDAADGAFADIVSAGILAA